MNRWIIFSLMLIAVVMTIVACAAPAPQIVEKTVVVEKPVEKIVEKTVVVKETSVPAVVTAAPAPKPAAKDTGTIVALGPFRGDDQVRFLAVIAEFNKANPKTKVIYAGTDQFNTLINVNVEAGNPPDIAPIPQPGLMQKFARDGKIVPLWPEVVKLIDQNYAPAWKDLGSYNGKVYGVFHRVNGKGYVYYNKPAFEKAGYKVPTTWEELQKLTADMAASGTPPWCISMENGASTGWVGTDWIESIMLRTQSVDTYDKWVNHTLKFQSPEVKNAWTIMNGIWSNPKLVYGGMKYIGATDYHKSGADLFDKPQKCQLVLQHSAYMTNFPKNVQADMMNQVGLFMLPPIDAKLPKAVQVGGDQWVVFNDRPEVRKFVEFLATGKSGAPWAKLGGALFPHKDQDLSVYGSAFDKQLASALIDIQAARFDASDAMDAAGNIAFWKGMTDYVGGKNIDDVLKQIDDGFPK